MSDLYVEKHLEIQCITEKYVKDLTQIWTQIFGTNMCIENLYKLMDHVKVFYEDLVTESLEKRAFIEKEINELKMEAETLRRLLKTEVELPALSDDLPLIYVQSEMDKSLEELRECLRQRREQICELLLEQEALCEELGEPPRPLLADPLPSEQEIIEFRTHLERLKEERVERMNRLSTMRREIKNFLQTLELKVSTDTEDRLLNHRQIKLNKETFSGLQRMHECYGAQVQEIYERIDGMRKKLDVLWNRLDTSPNTRNKFKRYMDYNQRTYDVFNEELQRCEALKSQNIKHFVQQIREEIVQWWDKTLKSDIQRSRFSNFNSNCYTDDLLVLHEMELEDLKHFYEANHQIFELYADRKILWDRMQALEAKASDPQRYNNRGGQLLKEEKERKTIATKLPKIEQQITDLVHEYEEREHEVFLIHGQNILDVMASEWERKRQDKEKLSSARKNGQTPLSKSHLNSRTPMSLKNVSSIGSSMRKTPSSTNLSTISRGYGQKRKLNPADKHTPVAKRSLMHVLNSPSVFLRPAAISTATKGSASAKKAAAKSPAKKARVIATTIRRKSGRQSGNLKKRRSLNRSKEKKTKAPTAAPRIVISDTTGSEICDDTYGSFEKCIEADSRSSIIIQHSSSSTADRRQRSAATQRAKHMQQIVNNENARLINLPHPRILRTPSKQIFQDTHHHPTHRLPLAPHSPSTGSSRKLTTKNLPIII